MIDSIVGFTISLGLELEAYTASIASQQRVVHRFPHLGYAALRIGETHLQVWGHGNLSARMHRLPDGALLVLAGSPHGRVSWREVEDALLAADGPHVFAPPWNGRFILLHITPDGLCWTLWNDWIGSIPLFHAPAGRGRIASTLEPVVVAAAGFTPNDFFLPGLVSLLINGHFLGDWTLFNDMKVVPPDCVAVWNDHGFHPARLDTVLPSHDRWEAGWDDLVDEMYDLSHRAIADVLKTQPAWTLPLSSGLDSRLIAAVGADVGANLHAYAWGAPDTTDVVYSRQIARTLGIPWKRIDLPERFLVDYTPLWADWFGSSMHFHGMYQMAFLDALKDLPGGPVISGFLGEVLSGDGLGGLITVHASGDSCQLEEDWYSHWNVDQVRASLKVLTEDMFAECAAELRRQLDAIPGAFHQKVTFLEIWNRQRLMTNFQTTLSDYWRGVAAPYLDRDYARFCLSLPRAVMEDRRLLGDVYRRYYGRLAVIPGTYANQPHVPTGRFLLRQRLAKCLPAQLAVGPLSPFEHVELRMDMVSVQACGRKALWPMFEAWNELAEWMYVGDLEHAYAAVLRSIEDIRPLRRLQSVQTIALRLASPCESE